MPLIFVHGVNVRKNPEYETVVSRRDAMFRRFLLSRLPDDWHALSIMNPYWGDEAARFFWNHASLPVGNEEVLGSQDSETVALLEGAVSDPRVEEHPVLSTALASGLLGAIDLLWVESSRRGSAEISDESALLAQRTLSYAEVNPRPQWITEARTDQEFLQHLKSHLDEWNTGLRSAGSAEMPPTDGREVLGTGEVWADLKETADRIASKIPSDLSRLSMSIAREGLHRNMATFLGDALVYLHQRDTNGEDSAILQVVLANLDAADKIRRETKEPLIVIAHSMGGNIMHDILTQMRTDFLVDVWVTVGTQVALLEELKLFANSDRQIPRSGLPLALGPPSVKKWINIFDTNDILSFPAGRIFANVSDYRYSTGKGLFQAHTSYFNRPSFQRHLSERIEGVVAK